MRCYLSRNIMQTHPIWILICMYIICAYNSFLEGFDSSLGSRTLWLQIRPQPENTAGTEKGKLDRASLAGWHHPTFSYTAPQGTRLTHIPFSLAVICCDPSRKDGPLWEVWDQQSQFGRPAGQGDKNTCAPPFAGYVQEKENLGGKSRLGALKASARLEMINRSHQVMY